MILSQERKQSVKESLIVFGFMSVVLMPVRLLFFTYVSEYWIGNLGVLSLIVIVILYLSYKQKLGYVGRLIVKKLDGIKQSKLTKWFIIWESIGLIVVGSLFFMYAVNDDSGYTVLFIDGLEKQNIDTLDELFSKNAEENNMTITENINITVKMTVNEPEKFVALMKVVDKLSGGWMSHFITIVLIEMIEGYVIVIYFRFFRKGVVKID